MLKKIIIILFVFISSSLNCFAADYQAVNKNYLQIIKQAQVYEAQGSIYKANQSYQEAEHIFPSRFESSFGLAKTYGWLKNTKEANLYFNQLLKKSPNNVFLKEQYACFLRDSGSYKLAINQFEQLENNTRQKKYLVNIAEIYYLQGEYNESIKTLSNLNQKEPNVIGVSANSYFNIGDYKNAQIYFKKALAFNNSEENQLKYAKSLFYSGNAVDAKSILEKLKPNTDISLTLSDVYLSLGDFQNASTTLEKLLKQSPDDLCIKLKYANSLMALNSFEQGAISAHKALL